MNRMMKEKMGLFIHRKLIITQDKLGARGQVKVTEVGDARQTEDVKLLQNNKKKPLQVKHK